MGEFQPSSSLESACYYGGAGGSLLLNLFTLGTEAKFVVKGGVSIIKSGTHIKPGLRTLGKLGREAKKINDVGKRLKNGQLATVKSSKSSKFAENHTLDQLSKAGHTPDRAGLTKAGRALDKHGNRPESSFPKATGNSVSKNQQGQHHLDDILTDPHGFSTPNEFGGFDYWGADVGGARFYGNGMFRGFLDNLW